ncbi:hypothetical protein ACFJIV_02555 [Mucilaginibacter sp. UC70_90]
MKTLCISLLLVCLAQMVNAQVSGRVTTAGSQPLPYVTVSLVRTADSSSVKSMLTNEQGGIISRMPLPEITGCG